MASATRASRITINAGDKARQSYSRVFSSEAQHAISQHRNVSSAKVVLVLGDVGERGEADEWRACIGAAGAACPVDAQLPAYKARKQCRACRAKDEQERSLHMASTSADVAFSGWHAHVRRM